MTQHHLPLKLVLTATCLLYINLPLFIVPDSYSQLPEVIKSLDEFVTKHEKKLPSFGLDPRNFEFLKKGHGRIKDIW